MRLTAEPSLQPQSVAIYRSVIILFASCYLCIYLFIYGLFFVHLCISVLCDFTSSDTHMEVRGQKCTLLAGHGSRGSNSDWQACWQPSFFFFAEPSYQYQESCYCCSSLFHNIHVSVVLFSLKRIEG